MALTHEYLETRSYYNIWIAICDIIDDSNGQRYHFEWNFPEQVTADSQVVIDQINIAKTDIQTTILYQQNDMNLTEDEIIAIEHLRDLKAAMVKRIRNNPNATLTQAQNYADTTFPNSVVNFTRLYQWYLKLLKLTTWDEFKTWCINHKFMGVD